jgi:hypothetical protein
MMNFKADPEIDVIAGFPDFLGGVLGSGLFFHK